MKLINNEKVAIGFDINDGYAQISYCIMDNGDVETLSSVAGEEVYNIPTVLCKREGVNQWLYGREALRCAKEQEGILIEKLLSLAVDGEPVQIEGETYQPVALLALFIKRSLGMLAQVSAKLAAIMFTCERLDAGVLEALNQAVEGLKLKNTQILFQSHMESFYYYMLRQQEELWKQQVLLCEYCENQIRVYRMECNRHTNPVVAYVESGEYPFRAYAPMPEEEDLRREKLAWLDEDFLELVQSVCENRLISSVYLIGGGFSEEWLKSSLRYLCKGRRVFQGNNLYSKGACYGMLERLQPSEMGMTHVFLGSDKLTTNIGMKILRRGQESYYALLDAGVNWFEADTTLEFYIQEGNCIELVMTSLTGRGNKVAQITLEELPEGISRLSMHLYLSSENHLQIEIEDLGFGDFREATHYLWKEEVEL